MRLTDWLEGVRNSRGNRLRRGRQGSSAPVAAVQSLEPRILLAAGVNLDGGVLQVEGTDGDDFIEVEYVDGGQSVRASVLDLGGDPTVPLAAGTFDSADVDSIFIDALAGNDEGFNTTDIPDEVRGGPGDDEIEGGKGASLVVGGGGFDDLTGRNGDDLLVVADADFDQVRGGSGFDTLRLDGTGETLDLRTRSDALLIRLEQIDLNGGGNHLVLDDGEVRALTDAGNTLRVLGTSDDTLHIDGGWTVEGTEQIDGDDFRVLSKEGATLKVHPDVVIVTNVVEVERLLGDGGFKIHGIDEEDRFGRLPSSPGDFNGDGFDDLIVGAPGAIDGFLGPYGQAYVVFGSDSGFGQRVDVADLIDDPTVGFGFQGRGDGDRLGGSVSFAGDINGDGFDEIAVGVPGEGVSYVVFGRKTDGSPIDIAPPNGFAINGGGGPVDSAGDVNGDGFDDLLVRSGSGAFSQHANVIFGHAGPFPAEFELDDLDGTNGFTVSTVDSYDGLSAAGAGDVNGDGFDDLILGVPGGDREVDPGGGRYDYDVYKYDTGEAYLIFGKADGFAADFELANDDGFNLDGFNGVLIKGSYEKDRLGVQVSPAGDVNGDGYDDVILLGDTIYAPNDPDSPHHDTRHQAYVIFGAPAFGRSLEISSLNGVHGFVIDNIPDRAGEYNGLGGSAVSAAGDFNDDGYDDLLVGAPRTFQDDASPNPQFPRLVDTGATFVVFGGPEWAGRTVDLANLNGRDGFALRGPTPTFDIDRDPQYEEPGAFGGTLAALGDFNGDGIDDIAIGDDLDDTNGENTGAVYVVYGGLNPRVGEPTNDAPVAADEGYGTDEDTTLTVAASSGVLANDSDANGDALTAALVSGPANGSLSLDSDGSFRYTPDADFNGTDTFTYKVSDGTAESNVATVTISVNAVDDAPQVTATAIGDFDGDGRDDAAALTGDGLLQVGLSDGSQISSASGNPWADLVDADDVAELLVGDFNNDGLDDIAAFAVDGRWRIGVSSGQDFSFTEWTNWSQSSSWAELFVGDFNGDGRDDIAGFAHNGRWYVGQGTGSRFATSLWTQWSQSSAWAELFVGDFNGDGRDDVAGFAHNGRWYVGQGTGSQFATSLWTQWSQSSAWADLAVGDFNGDGRDDVAGFAHNGTLWRGESQNGRFATELWSQRPADEPEWPTPLPADIDGDGDVELLGFWSSANAQDDLFSRLQEL